MSKLNKWKEGDYAVAIESSKNIFLIRVEGIIPAGREYAHDRIHVKILDILKTTTKRDVGAEFWFFSESLFSLGQVIRQIFRNHFLGIWNF